ncbi:death effector domain-containing protein isoform 3-T4 [Liasis olivaceus]
MAAPAALRRNAPGEGDTLPPQFPWTLGGRGRFSQSRKMATLKRSHQQAWPEEEGDREHGLYSLHRMFDIVGTHLTHRDVRVLSFLFVDVIDDYERGMIRSGRDFLLALERQGRCDETNFRQVLQLLRIITRHDLLPYVTLKRRKAVCPDLVDKYLEETSIRYVTPRAHSNTEHVPVHQQKSVPPHHPLVCCSSSGPQICAKRSGRGRALLGNQRKRRKSVTPDPKDKQTCDIRLRVRAEYCQHETALEGNVFSNKQDPLERQFERFSQANTILKSRDLGSIICDIKFSELTYLDAFWRDYINGSLLEALKGVFITDSLKQAVGHEAIKLLVNVDEEDYEVVAGFNRLRQEQRGLASKAAELEMELNEHKLVIETLREVDPTRRCYRMVGGVLVERTVKEVLPALENNKEQINKIIETLSQQLQTKGRELNEFREKHNIRLMGEDDQKAPSKESPEGAAAKSSSAGVLVS